MPSRDVSADLIRLAAGSHEILVEPARGLRAVSWSYEGLQVLAHHGDDPVEYGMYPMAPWAGRVRGNVVDGPDGPVSLPISYAEWALHGTALAAAMTVVEQRDGHVRATVPTPAWWPWPCTIEVAWELSEDEVQTEIAVHSRVAGCPAVVGWHPWFRRDLGTGRPVEWSLAAVEQAERGEDHLPTGSRIAFDADAGPFDDAFVVPTGRAALEWPGALRIDVESNADWYVVYDEQPATVCFEPQSGPPDGLRPDSVRPVQLAGPGAPVRLVNRWRLRRLED